VHELSIVEALIEQVTGEVEQAGARGPVTRVHLAVGRLSGAHPESIRFAFELLVPGTRLEGARLRIDEPRAVCRCDDCRASTEIEEFVVACPACDGRRVVIEGGRDLMLQTIEVEN